MGWKAGNLTRDEKKIISLSQDVTDHGLFQTGDLISSDKYIFQHWKVVTWGEFFDARGYIRERWNELIPIQAGDDTPTTIWKTDAKAFWKKWKWTGGKTSTCTKPACKIDTCSGPEWCKCYCEHERWEKYKGVWMPSSMAYTLKYENQYGGDVDHDFGMDFPF